MATWPPSSALRRPPPHMTSRWCRVRCGRRGRRLRWPVRILVSSQLKSGESSDKETHQHAVRYIPIAPNPQHGGTASWRSDRFGSTGCHYQVSFRLPRPGPTAAHWLDDPSDPGCHDSTCQYSVDGCPLSCNRLPCQVGGSPRGSPPGVTRWIIWCWLDSTPDLSCANGTRDHCVDVEHQPTDLAVAGSNPSRRAAKPKVSCILLAARRECSDHDPPELAAVRRGRRVQSQSRRLKSRYRPPDKITISRVEVTAPEGRPNPG